jgi:hypothetical protein
LKQYWKSIRPRFYIFYIIMLLGVLSGGYYSTVFSSNDRIPIVKQGEFLNLNSLTTQWLTINGHLNAISLIDGKLAVFAPSDDLQNWSEVQRFGPDGILFTTFQVKDINNDGMAEIIAGTVEPGFIYIYKLNNGKWELFNYGKYVWSAITYIAVGDFGGGPENDILVQNQEGSLYLLKMTDKSLDLIWQSPAVWRPITSGSVIDIDHDAKDEIMVVYKTGGIGILKMVSNSIVSVWENYPWGKVLAVTSGDWDHNQQIELLISTSQKVIYSLGWTAGGGYQFYNQWTQLNYTTERLLFIQNNGLSQLIATDTAGKSHLLEYDFKSGTWLEDYVVSTGRIAQIINTDLENTFLWGYNRKIIAMQSYATKEIKLSFCDVDYEIVPAPSFKNEILFIAPKVLQEIPDLRMTYKNNKTTFTITQGDQKIEVSKKGLTIKSNEKIVTLTEPPIVVDGDLQLSLASYQTLFKINLTFDTVKKTIQITDLIEPTTE